MYRIHGVALMGCAEMLPSRAPPVGLPTAGGMYYRHASARAGIREGGSAAPTFASRWLLRRLSLSTIDISTLVSCIFQRAHDNLRHWHVGPNFPNSCTFPLPMAVQGIVSPHRINTAVQHTSTRFHVDTSTGPSRSTPPLNAPRKRYRLDRKNVT